MVISQACQAERKLARRRVAAGQGKRDLVGIDKVQGVGEISPVKPAKHWMRGVGAAVLIFGLPIAIGLPGVCQTSEDPASVSPSPTDTLTGSGVSPTTTTLAAPETRRWITSSAHTPIRIANSPGKSCLMRADLGMQRLMASSSSNDSLISVSLDTGTLRPLNLTSLNALSIDEQDDKIFATTDDQSLLVLDRKSLVRIDKIVMPGHCGSVAYIPSCHKVLVAHQTSTEIWSIDSHLHTLGSSVRLKAPVSELIYDSATDKVLGLIDQSGQIAVIDPWTMTVTGYWSVPTDTHLTTLGIDSGLGIVFCGDDSGVLSVMDAQSGALIGSVPTGLSITATAYDPSAQQIYCLARNEGQVDVIQLARGGSSLNLGQISTVAGLESAAVIRGSNATQLWVSFADAHGSYLQCYSLLF
jgi:DNA-binding beta-propeller fold protein YncE